MRRIEDNINIAHGFYRNVLFLSPPVLRRTPAAKNFTKYAIRLSKTGPAYLKDVYLELYFELYIYEKHYIYFALLLLCQFIVSFMC